MSATAQVAPYHHPLVINNQPAPVPVVAQLPTLPAGTPCPEVLSHIRDPRHFWHAGVISICALAIVLYDIASRQIFTDTNIYTLSRRNIPWGLIAPASLAAVFSLVVIWAFPRYSRFFYSPSLQKAVLVPDGRFRSRTPLLCRALFPIIVTVVILCVIGSTLRPIHHVMHDYAKNYKETHHWDPDNNNNNNDNNNNHSNHNNNNHRTHSTDDAFVAQSMLGRPSRLPFFPPAPPTDNLPPPSNATRPVPPQPPTPAPVPPKADNSTAPKITALDTVIQEDAEVALDAMVEADVEINKHHGGNRRPDNHSKKDKENAPQQRKDKSHHHKKQKWDENAWKRVSDDYAFAYLCLIGACLWTAFFSLYVFIIRYRQWSAYPEWCSMGSPTTPYPRGLEPYPLAVDLNNTHAAPGASPTSQVININTAQPQPQPNQVAQPVVAPVGVYAGYPAQQPLQQHVQQPQPQPQPPAYVPPVISSNGYQQFVDQENRHNPNIQQPYHLPGNQGSLNYGGY